ncbi:MAG: hypothetical protein WED15_06020 [Akkermansiaceae bacterium]
MLETQLLIPLLATCLVLLLLVLFSILQIQTRLGRIEKIILREFGPETAPDSGPAAAETPSGSAFEAFLTEDPVRRAMSKSEQFAAFRGWRKEKGMNWSNP